MSLRDRIIARIATDGPMSVADYMAICLFDETEGYYATREPFGTRGDFITAPEISQMFGELIGLALAQTWLDQGAAPAFNLVEFGPGRGTLMADILRATRAVSGFHEALDLHLIEASPRLRKIQSETIAQNLTHHFDISTLPPGPVFAVANEFFDALPIRQFQRVDGGWAERVIRVEGDALSIGLTAVTPPPALHARHADTTDGDIVEICEDAQTMIRNLGGRIVHDGGAALVIDYGGWRSLGDTFQAVRDHAPVSPFADPGQADLTAHVDFEALAAAAAPAQATEMVPQGLWLERLGITLRAQTLAQTLQGADLDEHIAAHRRLTHPDQMGTLFKVMALHPPDHAAPPGFADDA